MLEQIVIFVVVGGALVLLGRVAWRNLRGLSGCACGSSPDKCGALDRLDRPAENGRPGCCPAHQQPPRDRGE
jgi:hypothetical protein